MMPTRRHFIQVLFGRARINVFFSRHVHTVEKSDLEYTACCCTIQIIRLKMVTICRRPMCLKGELEVNFEFKNFKSEMPHPYSTLRAR